MDPGGGAAIRAQLCPLPTTLTLEPARAAADTTCTTSASVAGERTLTESTSAKATAPSQLRAGIRCSEGSS